MKKSPGPWRVLLAATIAVAMFAAALSVAACGGSDSSGEANAAPATDTIVGAGATFPYPVYTKWGSEYAATGGAKLNYQGIGSGGGISAVTAGTVEFGASDAPLEQSELDAANLAQFPMIVGGVVPVVNIEGVGKDEIKLTADVLAKIYDGDIATWDDQAITSLNPDVKLPSAKINVVHRSDGSGTTWIFTHYLEASAPGVWTAGADKEVNWPTGVGGKGNEGVASSVKQINGSIGYVEYAYAEQADLTTVQLQNKDGKYVTASLDTFQNAAAQADWQSSLPSMYLILVDQPGADTWPIAGASFILIPKDQQDAGAANTMLSFFDWAYQNGAETAKSLDYVPIPENVYSLVQSDVWKTITVSGTPVWQ